MRALLSAASSAGETAATPPASQSKAPRPLSREQLKLLLRKVPDEDPLRALLALMRSRPVLGDARQAEAIARFKRWQAGLEAYALKVEAGEQQTYVDPSPEEFAAVMGWSEADARELIAAGGAAREELILHNLGLVLAVARLYRHRGMLLVDRIQEGVLGLERGIVKFDPARGWRLSTYVWWWIRQAITRAIARQGRLVRVPEHVLEKAGQLRRVRVELRRRLDREPAEAELAAALEVEIAELRQLLVVESDRVVSLDAPRGLNESGDELSSWADILSAPVEASSGPALSDERIDRFLGMARLDGYQKMAVVYQFGLLRRPALGMKETAAAMSAELGEEITRDRVKNLRSSAMQRLRKLPPPVLAELRELLDGGE